MEVADWFHHSHMQETTLFWCLSHLYCVTATKEKFLILISEASVWVSPDLSVLRTLTSVIIFPLVLFRSRWLALFCFCCSTRSLVVRYSRANSLRILLKRWMLTSRTAYTGWPRNNRKAWNLQAQGALVLRESSQLAASPSLCLRLHQPVDYPSVHNLQNDDPLRAVLEEVRHLLLQRRLHLVFGDDLEVIPWCLAPPLHLGQIVLQLIEVHLSRTPQTQPATLSSKAGCVWGC